MNFDLHCHPSTKPFLTGINAQKRKDCWTTICIHLIFGMDEWEGVGGDRLDSQSSLTQMKEGQVGLTVLPLHALEHAFAEAGFFNLIMFATKPELSNARISRKLLRRIRKNRNGYTPFDNTLEELKHLSASQGDGFAFVSKIDDDLPKNQINALLAIEGAHCLLTINPDDFKHEDQTQINQALDRYKEISDTIKLNKGRLAFLTLTHIGRGPLCTQAFAYSRPKEKQIGEEFMPKDVGATAIRKVGWKVIKKSLKDGVLIDLKHTSYRARCEYYEYVKTQAAKGKHIPIIASHMGAAGVAFTRYRNHLKKSTDFHHGAHKIVARRYKGLFDLRFYTIALNLFDEEIRFIVDNQGLIGISLDERILGRKRDKASSDTTLTYEFDYMSPNDMAWCRGEEYDTYRSTVFSTVPSGDFDSDEDRSKDKGIYYLCNNILRFVYAGGKEAWKHLCIGSDYDGLIDAINECETADRLPQLRLDILNPLKESILSVDNPEETFHVDLDNLDADLKQKVDDLFENNGFSFLKKHFSTDPISLI